MSKSVLVPFVRSAYNYDSMLVSDESAIIFNDPSLAIQSSAEECDINNIVDRFLRGQTMDSPPPAVFADLTSTPESYHEAMNMVLAADSAFSSLPAKVRARFENSPVQLLQFLEDPSNYDEAVKLGFVAPASSPLDVEPSVDGSLRQKAGGASSGRDGSAVAKPSIKAQMRALLGDTGDE